MSDARPRWKVGIRRTHGPELSADLVPQHVAPGANSPARHSLFRKEVLDFQQHDRQWGRVVPLQPLSMRLLVWGVILAATGVVAFLFVAQYARKEVVAGYLAPIAGSTRVFAPQAGTVSNVFVKQGDTVALHQPLLAVAAAQFSASGEDINASVLNTLQQQRESLTRGIADAVRKTESERQRMSAEIQEQEGVLQHLQAQATVQQHRITILGETVQAGQILRSKGLVSELDQHHREEALLEQQQALIGLNQQMVTRNGQLSEIRFNLQQLPFTQAEKIQALRNELAATDQRVAEVNARNAYVVRSPVAGRVALLQAVVGQQTDPHRLQLEILPENSPLRAQLYIPVRAIGFVQPGQDVRLLFDAFPYQRFGTSHGRITDVSQTVLLPSDLQGQGPIELKEPAYAASVALDRASITANGKKIPLQPDMSLQADIILEKRTLVDWIFAPLRHLRIDE